MMGRRPLAFVAALAFLPSLCIAATMEKARMLHANGLVREAKAELIEIVTEAAHPERPGALLLLGQIQKEEGNEQLATETWSSLAREHPNSPEADLIRHAAGKVDPTRQVVHRAKAAPRLDSEGQPPRRQLVLTPLIGGSESLRTRVILRSMENCSQGKPWPLYPQLRTEVQDHLSNIAQVGPGEYEATYSQELSMTPVDASGSAGPQAKNRLEGRIRFNAWRELVWVAPELRSVLSPDGFVAVPAEAVGSGARWTHVAAEWSMGGQKIDLAPGQVLEAKSTFILRGMTDASFEVFTEAQIPEVRTADDALMKTVGQTTATYAFDRLLATSVKSEIVVAFTELKGLTKQKRGKEVCMKVHIESL